MCDLTNRYFNALPLNFGVILLQKVKSPEILQPHFLHLNKLLDQVVRQESAENKLTTHDQVVPLGNEPRKIKKIVWFQVLLLILQFFLLDKNIPQQLDSFNWGCFDNPSCWRKLKVDLDNWEKVDICVV